MVTGLVSPKVMRQMSWLLRPSKERAYLTGVALALGRSLAFAVVYAWSESTLRNPILKGAMEVLEGDQELSPPGLRPCGGASSELVPDQVKSLAEDLAADAHSLRQTADFPPVPSASLVGWDSRWTG